MFHVTVPASLTDRLPGAVAGRLRKDRADAVDPALAAYLNEQLAAATALVEDLRRAAREEDLLAEREVLLRLRSDVAADRATVRAAVRRLGIPTDWTGLGVTWASGRAAALLPLLHRLPVLERIPTAAPARGATVHALLVLEQLLGGLHRRAVAARLLSDLVGEPAGDWARAVRALPARAQAQLSVAEAAHRRCATPLLP